MSSLLAQVVAQLNSAIEQLDTLAIRALRAQQDVVHSQSQLDSVGRGSDHPKLRKAVDQSGTAADKTGRLARLSSTAAGHLATYANTIAPGSASRRDAAATNPPTGEDLVADSQRRELVRSNVSGFLNRAVRKADELQDKTTQATDRVQQSINVLRNPTGPPETHSAGTGTPAAPATAPRPKIDGEAAGNLVVVGLLAGVAAHRITTVIGERIARFGRRGDNDSQRPDSGTGQR